MKVLVAPLGNGIRKTGNTDRNIKYEVTKYRFPDNEKNFETSLIFEAIIRYQLSIREEIDEIILVGTVHSCWQDLYDYCIDRREKRKGIPLSDEELDYFDQIEKESQKVDRNSSTEELERFQKFLHPLEQMISENLLEDHLLNVHIQIMQYGMNESETFFNYHKMCSGIEQYTREGERMDIILDITHSFRSMPIYYFLVLNYLMRISRHDVNVSAIYYGMFELKMEENLDYTPVVNMNYLISAMNWINGLNEVNSYGSVYSVTNCLEKDNHISDWLQVFEWATNTNDYSLLTEAITEITTADITQDTYTAMGRDALQRITQILQEKFPNGSVANVALTQCNLAQWFFEQRRYGLAILTIQECVKTHLTYLMLKYWDKNRLLTMGELRGKIFDEGTRNNSISLLKNIAEKEPLMGKLLEFYNEGKDMRNTMAHVLSNTETDKKTGSVLMKEISDQRDQLEKYIQWVGECIRHDRLRPEVQRQAFRRDESPSNLQNNTSVIYDQVVFMGKKKKKWNWNGIYGNCHITAKQLYCIERPGYETEFQSKKSYQQECDEMLKQLDAHLAKYTDKKTMVLVGNTNLEKELYLIRQLDDRNVTVKLLGGTPEPGGKIALTIKNVPFKEKELN